MKRKVRVYIASPYSIGDKDENTKLQATATYHLLRMGFNPYMPLYHHYVQKEYPILNDMIDWLEIDKDWLKDCDMAVRLHPRNEKGEVIPSSGADEEETFCKEHNIPMFHFDSIESMIPFLEETKNTIDI